MKRYLFINLYLLSFLASSAQIKTYEYNYPRAILLDSESLSILTSQDWHIYQIDWEIKGNFTSAPAYGTIRYHSDLTFNYGSADGNWTLTEGKYINHSLKHREDEVMYKFGGIYSVTTLTDSTLTLTKVLTSSYDLKRTIHLMSTPSLPGHEQYVYRDSVDQHALDSIRSMSTEQLFMYGFSWEDDTILIQIEDSLYRIKRNINTDERIKD